MQSKIIKQEVILSCSPQTAYNAWLDSKIHGEMINAHAVIDPNIGGMFSIWDDYLIGKTIELDPKSLKIVQEWRDTSTDWTEGHYSTITLQFTQAKDNQTKLIFTQKGVPEKHIESIEKGWEDYYWKPMQQYFSKQR